MKLLVISLSALCCLWSTLVRSVHLFQLESYQFPGYMRALKTYKKRFLSPKTLFPMAVFAVLGAFAAYFTPLAAGLFLLINPAQKMKKPLVFTPRVRRLCAVSVALSALICLPGALVGVWALGVSAAAAVILTPYLLIAWGHICAPVEKAISNRYISDARRILREHTRLKVVGITGSFGKTSTKYFLYDLLSQKYNVYMTPGNFNTTLGVTRAVREGLLPQHEIFLCEMGARHVGDIKEICELAQPDIAVITSVGKQHLETFGSLERVLSTKLELHDAVKDCGSTFVNVDSAPLRDALPKLEGDIITCGAGGGYYASGITADKNGLRFTIHTPEGDSQEFSTRLLGDANVQNLTLAIACAHRLGVSLRQMVPAVRALKSVPHRLELKNAGDMTLIDDAYNSNPEGAKMALDALALFAPCRVLVTPGLVELGASQQEENRALGEYAAGCCDLAIIVGAINRDELARGLRSGGMTDSQIITAKTIEEALRQLPAGGKTVLLLNDLPDNYL
ncbi:MAG: UDP-N-acetylmuramoyl-tripeptide--D-alanyl-D-alanine ligase [Clostridia bacterium]|nr:UDP-N-acetylmuramoyl-tripeptide--D-alanyl-D-alanine ligase [Clostridia bacterium]